MISQLLAPHTRPCPPMRKVSILSFRQLFAWVVGAHGCTKCAMKAQFYKNKNLTLDCCKIRTEHLQLFQTSNWTPLKTLSTFVISHLAVNQEVNVAAANQLMSQFQSFPLPVQTPSNGMNRAHKFGLPEDFGLDLRISHL